MVNVLLLIAPVLMIHWISVKNGGANIPIVTWTLRDVKSESVMISHIHETYAKSNWVININAIGLLVNAAIKRWMIIPIPICGVRK